MTIRTPQFFTGVRIILLQFKKQFDPQAPLSP